MWRVGGSGGAGTKGLLDVLIQGLVCGATTSICGRVSLRTGFVALDIRLDALANGCSMCQKIA